MKTSLTELWLVADAFTAVFYRLFEAFDAWVGRYGRRYAVRGLCDGMSCNSFSRPIISNALLLVSSDHRLYTHMNCRTDQQYTTKCEEDPLLPIFGGRGISTCASASPSSLPPSY